MASGGNTNDNVAVASPQFPLIDDKIFASPASSQTLLAADDENTPLLPKSHKDRPWYRQASPKLLVPFALASAICHGMTLAPRVEVFTRISCDQVHIDTVRTYSPTGFNPVQVFSMGPMPFSVVSLPPVYAALGHNATLVTPSDCRLDPNVQQATAKLQALIMTLTGALSALTSGVWGQWSDRHGRTRVMALCIFAMLAADLVFVFAASQSARPLYSFLTASRILVLSPLIEGSFGGLLTLQAAFNAYISDVTPAGTSRAKIFSRFLGITFVGLAAGPTLGSVLPFNPFWISITIGVSNLLLLLLFLPESLSKEQHDALAASRALTDDQKPVLEGRGPLGNIHGYAVATVRSVLEPMKILLPRKRVGQGQAVAGEDWSLTFLAMSLFLYLLAVAIYGVKILYAQHTFGWNTEQVSYYLSFIGSLRALNLIFVLPYLIKVYKPKSSKQAPPTGAYPSPAISPHGSVTVINTPVTSMPARTTSLPAVPLSPPSPSPSPSPEPGTSTGTLQGLSYTNAQLIKQSIRLAREQHFDLHVARLSMFMDFLSYFLLCSSSSPAGFVLSTSLTAFGCGTSPALQSLALGILGHDQADVGKLFGALSMLSSVSSTILSPLIFGSLYSLTVTVFPQAIFIIATGVLMVALLSLALVQPSRPLRRRDVEDFPPRGRSRRAKDLRRSYSN